jgi:hypothetical protein
MDVRLSGEQQALRDSAAQLVDRLGPRTVAQIGEPERSEKLNAAVEATAWRELRVGTLSGDPLASGVEAVIVGEELGRALADVSFLGATLGCELRRLTGALPSDSIETVALDPSLLSVVRTDEYSARVAVDTQGASRALLLVPDSGVLRLAEIACNGAPAGPDLTRPSVALDSALSVTPVESAERPMSAQGLQSWTALGLALTCADLVGIMRGAVQLGCDYAAQRRQYGAAIGSFQAVQHLLADSFVAMEGSRSVTLHAAWAVDALPADDALAAAAAAKAYCARAARQVCETTIQVHGGIGNTWECLAHVFLRRALLSTDLLGDARVNLARVLDHYGIAS